MAERFEGNTPVPARPAVQRKNGIIGLIFFISAALLLLTSVPVFSQTKPDESTVNTGNASEGGKKGKGEPKVEESPVLEETIKKTVKENTTKGENAIDTEKDAEADGMSDAKKAEEVFKKVEAELERERSREEKRNREREEARGSESRSRPEPVREREERRPLFSGPYLVADEFEFSPEPYVPGLRIEKINHVDPSEVVVEADSDDPKEGTTDEDGPGLLDRISGKLSGEGNLVNILVLVGFVVIFIMYRMKAARNRSERGTMFRSK